MARQFWMRYLEVFDRVRIVARATRVEQPPEGWLPVNSETILFHALPDYCGPWECLKRYPALRAAIRSAVPAHGAVILRVASQIATMLAGHLNKKDHPYGLEVLGDPAVVFANGVVDHPLRPFFRWNFTRNLRKQCLRANGVAYVTKHALQALYPAQVMSTSFSDVDLPEEAIVGSHAFTHYSSIELETAGLATSVRTEFEKETYNLVLVGSLAQLYKGADVLIEAIARCVRAGFNLTAAIVGDGKYRPVLMAQAERAGIASRIRFLGQVTAGEAVRQILDGADLFVLPSRTEGLPRALIEAMARAVPCIGSTVGGIPELLDKTDLVPPGDPAALASKIQEVLRSPERMKMMAHRNLQAAMEFRDVTLAERRRRFYRHIRDCTQRWEMAQRR
jgi:glycosyltransferase involved in cell wall biosynthesis